MMDIPQGVVLPDELIGEILSYLSVKTLMRLRTVNKAWKTLISNPTFVKLHLQRSSRNTLLALEWPDYSGCVYFPCHRLSLFPVLRILENLPISVDYGNFCNNVALRKDKLYSYDSYRGDYNDYIVGSYNGLVCFYSRRKVVGAHPCYSEYWLNFRNLAMGTESEKLGYFLDSENAHYRSFKFSFGYDNSTETYKAVAFRVLRQEYNSQPSWTSEVKVFNLGDNSWRNIQSFPVLPLCFVLPFGVHLIGTVNWLALTNTSGALHGWTHINAESLVILSLSLSTETYTQLLLPKGLNHDLHAEPTLRVLGSCLCFSHDFRRTEFVIWQMREFGVRESWTQLIKVSYETLQMENLPMGDDMHGIQLLPLYLFEDSNTLIFASAKKNVVKDNQALIYNWNDDRVERTRFSKDVSWFYTIDYVESLVPTP